MVRQQLNETVTLLKCDSCGKEVRSKNSVKLKELGWTHFQDGNDVTQINCPNCSISTK